MNMDLFAEIRKHKESSDKYKTEDYCVLEALEEIIKARKTISTQSLLPVEYFSCIMTTLTTSADKQRSLLYLLQIVLPVVSDNVKRLKCNDCLDILLNIYNSRKNDIEPSTTRSLVTCIAEVLLVQETENELWESNIVRKSFTLLLTLCLHDSGKVRRCVQDVLQPIMERHCESGFSVTSRLATRQLDILCKEFNEDDYHDVINYLVFIAQVIHTIHHECYSSLFQTLLKLRQHQCPMIDSRVLRPLEILLESDRYLDSSLVETLFTQLQSNPSPATGNEKDVSEYITVLSLLCQSLLQSNPDHFYEHFILVTRGTISYFLTANTALYKSLSLFLIRFYPSLISISFPDSIVHQIINLYMSTLQFKYQHAWIFILPSIAALVRLFGPMYPRLFGDMIQQLVAIYDSSMKGDAAFKLILSKTLGFCIESVGPAVFMEFVSIIDEHSGLPIESHYFLLELIAEHTRHTQSHLLFFFEHLLPIAKACHNAASTASNSMIKRRYVTYVTDIWAMFTSFCVCAVDAATVIPQYMKSILGAMTDVKYKELSVTMCKGITLLIRSCQLALEEGVKEKEMIDDDDDDDDDGGGDSDDSITDNRIKDDDFGDEILPFLDILKTTRAPRLSHSVAAANLEVLQPLCESLLLTLLSLYEQWHGDFSVEIPRFSGIGSGGDNMSVQVVRCALETVFSVSPTVLVSKMLNQILEKLLMAFTNEVKEEEKQAVGQSIILSGLLSTVIRYVKDQELLIILRCLHPHLNNDQIPVLQKRVYFCLLCICKYHAPLLVTSMLNELTSMFNKSVLSLNVVSKKYRLRGLYFLSQQLNGDNEDHLLFIINQLPEVVLSIKDSSNKVRLVCTSILFCFSDLMLHSHSTYHLIDGSEVVASLSQFYILLTSFLTAESTHMQAAALQSLAMVVGHHAKKGETGEVIVSVLKITYELMKDDSKEIVKAGLRFIRTSCRVMNNDNLLSEIGSIIGSILSSGYDYKNRFRPRIRAIIEALLQRVGEDEMRNQMPEVDLPLLTNILRAERRKNSKNRKDDDEGGTSRAARKHTNARYIREDEDPLDLLNVEDVTRGVSSQKEEEESESEMEMDEKGRFIVREEEEEEEEKQEGTSRKRIEASQEVTEEKTKSSGKKIGPIQRRGKAPVVTEDGSRFKSTKAKGDMKKGGIDPYAYVSLDSRMLSKKKTNQSLGKFKNLIGAAKKGAKDGAAKRRRQN